jgi:hypothetical protein
LVLSKLIDNASLTPIFKQIKMMKSLTQHIYLSTSFAGKFIQRFPSFIHIELQVFSFDHCVSLIEIFLIHLEYLSHLKIYYNQDTLLDDPFSRDYIIGKRRQTFPNNIINKQTVNVKNNGKAVEIWLS